MAFLDQWISESTRLELERRYWDPIEATGSLESLLSDPEFVEAPGKHLSLFADHSATHARDVAGRVLQLLDEHHGTLFGERDGARLNFMRTYGVWLTYLHDVGMVESTPEGRLVHAQYAAQLVFEDEFDDLIDAACQPGPLVDRVREVFGDDEKVVNIRVRELLAMSLCHSKSTIPTPLLTDLPALRRAATVAVCVDLADHQAARAEGRDWMQSPLDDSVGRLEGHAAAGLDPFGWLDAQSEEERALVDDVLDTVRVLRVADALRQRGRDLRTSGGFEVFVDDTGRAVFHLAAAESDVAIHLRVISPLSVGEANIAAATLEPDGDLRIALNRSSFTPEAHARVAEACALVIIDIARDVLDVFPAALHRRILIENHPDDNTIGTLVQRALGAGSEFGDRTAVVPSLANCSEEEQQRYAEAAPVVWDSEDAEGLLDSLASMGFRADEIAPARCFTGVRRARVRAGDVLMREGDPATFVYVPTSAGLQLHPGGGFATQPLGPWRRLGVTGVLSRGSRNSTITATRDLDVFMIPGDIYAQEWFRPYQVEHLDDVRALVDPC